MELQENDSLTALVEVTPMREKLAPFVPAIMCAFLGLITIVGNISLMVITRTNQANVDVAFYCFLPMCFYIMGVMLAETRKENRELRARLDTLAASDSVRNQAA